VFTRADAARAGLSRHQVTQRLVNGRWRQLQRGAFCLAHAWEQASPEQRHALLAGGVLLTRRDPGPQALSHVTAAVMHGLPVSDRLLDTVWLTGANGSGRSTRYGRQLRREVAELATADVVVRQGLPVTRLARTVADCLRHLDLAESVSIADAALHAGLSADDRLRLDHVVRVLDGQASWPYARAALRALPLVDARRESALESRSAVTMLTHGLPPAEPQARIFDAAGSFVGRVDFLWRRQGVVGEADGAMKYRGEDTVRVIRAEKDRQARLEELGLVVVRWDWRHLAGDPPELVARLWSALRRGDGSAFRGLVA